LGKGNARQILAGKSRLETFFYGAIRIENELHPVAFYRRLDGFGFDGRSFDSRRLPRNAFVASLWRGNDLVTLGGAVPLLVASMFFARRGSPRGLLVWLGMLAYALYNFAFYLFGAAFNHFFLFYVAIFTRSIYALVFALVKIDAELIGKQFRERTPVNLIGGYMLFIAAGVSFLWVAGSLSFVFSGQVPAHIVKTGHPTGIVYALDLSLLVPVLALGGVWLWRRENWGYVLAAMSLIKGTTYTLFLTVTSLFAISEGARQASAELPIWLSVTIANLMATGFLLGNMKPRLLEENI
jgi:hypothetical protein